MTLYQITFVVNFLALTIALWLGMYLVTRSPRAPTAWLTALTLWSLGGVFLNVLLALNPPPIEPYRLSWLRFLFPFWPSGTSEGGGNVWLQGWSVIPSIAFWHHATMYMRPGKMNPWRWTRVIGAYILAIAAIEVQTFTPILFSVAGGNPLYINSLSEGPLFSFFGIVLVGLIILCIINLVRSAYVAPSETARRQLNTLVTATVIAGLFTPVLLLSSGLGLFPMPMVVVTFILAIFIVMVGYGVARYSALVQGRTLTRDFVYNLSAVTIITAFYYLTTQALVLAYEAPSVITIIIPLIAIVTHTAIDIAKRAMDNFFFKRDERRLRENLQHLSRLAGDGEALKENLEQTLSVMCHSVRATYGIVFMFEQDVARPITTFRWRDVPFEIAAQMLSADDVTHLTGGLSPAPLHEAALLVPLYAESEQVGALVLGRPTNGTRYAKEDVAGILDPADRFGEVIYRTRRRTEYLTRLSEMTEEHREHTTQEKASLPVEAVESVLRNLSDYSHLADTPLAGMNLVNERLTGVKKTHLERGKIVYTVVVEALEQMRPGHEIPRDPPPRAWYPYLILRDAYLVGVPNRDIMSKLYISEGTFNRTRRAAIRSLARALVEMEMHH
jgi:hypothetical protein